MEDVHSAPVPSLERIVVAIDPHASATKRSDACGIVAAGLDAEGVGWVLADASLAPAKPHEWARRAIALFHRLEADLVIAEVNQGDDMVAAVIATEDAHVPVRSVRANRGKALRAEPIAALYEQGRVRQPDASRNSRTRCAISRQRDFRAGVRRIVSMRWYGRLASSFIVGPGARASVS